MNARQASQIRAGVTLALEHINGAYASGDFKGYLESIHDEDPSTFLASKAYFLTLRREKARNWRRYFAGKFKEGADV